MKPVDPIFTVELFPGVSRALLDLLREISPSDWNALTVCDPWTVRDVVAHLLGGTLGRLSFGRDRHTQPRENNAPLDYAELVGWIDRQNAAWIEASRRLSPSLLIDFLELTDPQLDTYFRSLPPLEASGPAVAWAGDIRSPNWFDIAREYTEKWHHQQHIREAVGRPGLMERRWLFPVLDTFMRALPHTYRHQNARSGTAVTFTITGAAGGEWSLLRREDGWDLYSGPAPDPITAVSLDQDLAWRLFTRGVSPGFARAYVTIEGDQPLGSEILNMVSIMA